MTAPAASAASEKLEWHTIKLIENPVYRYGLVALAVAYIFWSVGSLEVDLPRLARGLPRAWDMLARMFPPNFERWELLSRELQFKKWSANKHATAMETLKKVGYDRSPECVVCHTVGYGATDGYKSMKETPKLGRVSCEVCHGRGLVLRNGQCKGRARPGNEATCRQCHTPKRHPDFNYKKQWDKINHKEDE